MAPSPSFFARSRPRRSTRRRLAHRAAALCAALPLAACQVPGDPALAGTSVSSSATPIAVPMLPGNCGNGGGVRGSDSAAQALAKLNDYRAVGARCGHAGNFSSTGPLQWQATLAQVAATRARSLADAGGSAPAGDEPLMARLTDAGYAAQAAAENRAAGSARLALVLADWVRLPTACAQMLSASYTEAGLACQRAADGSAHWVLVLAKPR